MEEDLKNQCTATIQRLVDLCGRDDGKRRPLRVAVIGVHGNRAGKGGRVEGRGWGGGMIRMRKV